MDINDLFDGIMKSIKQFPMSSGCRKKMQDNGLEHSEQTVREPQASPEGMPMRSRAQTGRGPENGGKNAENFEAKETNLPGRRKFGQPKAGRKATGHRDVACNRGVKDLCPADAAVAPTP